MNLNKVFVLGRLTADPQLKTTPSGQSVVNFSIATNRVWTDKSGNRQESAEYHNIVVWGKQAEIASQFLTKGSLALIEGRLQTRSWQDNQNQNRKTTEIICERIQLGPRPAGQSGPARFTPDEKRNNPSSGSVINRPDENQLPPLEEIPVIDIDIEKNEIKSEDLPF